MEDPDEKLIILQRQNTQLKGVLLACFLCFSISAGLAFHISRSTQIHAPKIISQIAEKRLEDAHEKMALRANEAHLLVDRLYGFLSVVLEYNTPAQNLKGHWANININLTTLTSDVAALPTEPLKAGTRIFDSGPARIESILDSAAAISSELQQLIPKLLNALKDARSALHSQESTLGPMLLTLDALITPLITHNVELQKMWSDLKQDIEAWLKNVALDFATFRQSLRGESISSEFMVTLWDEIF